MWEGMGWMSMQGMTAEFRSEIGTSAMCQNLLSLAQDYGTHMMLAFSIVHTMTPVVAVSAAWLWLPP